MATGLHPIHPAPRNMWNWDMLCWHHHLPTPQPLNTHTQKWGGLAWWLQATPKSLGKSQGFKRKRKVSRFWKKEKEIIKRLCTALRFQFLNCFWVFCPVTGEKASSGMPLAGWPTVGSESFIENLVTLRSQVDRDPGPASPTPPLTGGEEKFFSPLSGGWWMCPWAGLGERGTARESLFERREKKRKRGS